MERGVPDARDAVDLGVSGGALAGVIQGHQQVVFLFQKSKNSVDSLLYSLPVVLPFRLAHLLSVRAVKDVPPAIFAIR